MPLVRHEIFHGGSPAVSLGVQVRQQSESCFQPAANVECPALQLIGPPRQDLIKRQALFRFLDCAPADTREDDFAPELVVGAERFGSALAPS